MYKISLLMILGLIVSCGQKEDKLIVGMELAYPPFETKNNDGQPIGVSVDLATALGKYLGKEVVIENISWTGLIPALQTGKIDLVISSMTITEERKKQIDFSDPYAQVRIAMLVDKDSSINSITDLNQTGRIVSVKQGTTPFLYAREYLTNAKINSFASESAAVTEMLQGKADAVLYDQLTIYYNYQRNQDKTKIITINQDEKDIERLGIAVKKGNEELLTNINEFLVEFQKNGKFDELTKKYLTVEKEAFDKFGMEFFF